MDLENELDEFAEIGGGEKRLLNDQQIYVVGILSIIFWIPVGTIMAVFSLIRANEELDDFRANPTIYSRESYQKVKQGRTLALIALGLQILSIPAFIIFAILVS